MKRIVCFHLFNDFSGSPKVLRMVLGGLLERGEWSVESGELRVECGELRVDVVTSKGEGALSDLDGRKGVRMHRYAYRFSERTAVTMVRYIGVQLYLFFFALRYAFCKDTTFYVNTLLPVGAALAGRLTGKRVVYHYHEDAVTKGAFYLFLSRAMQVLASDIICVSAYQRSFLQRKEHVQVVPNAVPATFVARLQPDPMAAFDRQRVLLLGSLKRYKGTLEFVELARRMPEYPFELVLNETPENIAAFWRENGIRLPENLTVHPRQQDVVPFYNRATIVLNLSNKHEFVETFGMTVLEALSAGLPVIVPTVGGVAELVEDGRNGWKIDVENLDAIEAKLRALFHDRMLYCQLAEQALNTAQRFSEESMLKQIKTVIDPK